MSKNRDRRIIPTSAHSRIYMSSPEERIMSLGAPVEDPEFINLLRSRLHMLLNLTRYADMYIERECESAIHIHTYISL